MLHIKINQDIACYRIPTMGNIWVTYPLPQPSTIFGMLRAITGYMSINYLNSRIAIAGTYQSVNTHIENMALISGQNPKNSKTNTVQVQLLHDISLSIYIDSYPEAEKAIYENQLKVGRLGRSEDIVIDIKVESISSEFVEIGNEAGNEVSTKYYFLAPFTENIDGQIFRMALDIDKELLEKGIRKAIWRKFLYLSQEAYIYRNYDSKVEVYDGEPIVWLNSIQRT